jgi:hypothetical protein
MCEGKEKINLMDLNSNEQKFLQEEIHNNIFLETND